MVEEKKEQQVFLQLKKQSQLKEVWRRFKKNRLALFGLIVIVALILVAAFADLIRPYEAAVTMNVMERLAHPSATFWFGTDGFGRDVFARIIHGARASLFISFTTSILAMVFGGALGLVAAFYGNKTDNAIMRVLDVFSAIPTILLALTIVAALGTSIFNLIIALMISRIAAFARIIRSSVLTITDQEYIEAARAGGTSDFRIMFRHILPNALAPLIVQTTMNVSAMILQTAALSFLGLGISAPQPEWGGMISEARQFMRVRPLLLVFPGMSIVLASLSINLLGDGLRDALDPRLKT
jgi:peptide/nickel transport system permease protein